MFRVMFNTAFVQSNILALTRDEIDLVWSAKDHFPKDFKIEVGFCFLEYNYFVSHRFEIKYQIHVPTRLSFQTLMLPYLIQAQKWSLKGGKRHNVFPKKQLSFLRQKHLAVQIGMT